MNESSSSPSKGEEKGEGVARTSLFSVEQSNDLNYGLTFYSCRQAIFQIISHVRLSISVLRTRAMVD